MKTIHAALIVIAGLALSQPAFAKTHPHARQVKQEGRIKEGVKSGALTKGEAKDLQQEHKAIGAEIKADKAANGGKLSKGDRKTIRKQRNAESKKIYQDKHNSETRPESPAADKK